MEFNSFIIDEYIPELNININKTDETVLNFRFYRP